MVFSVTGGDSLQPHVGGESGTCRDIGACDIRMPRSRHVTRQRHGHEALQVSLTSRPRLAISCSSTNARYWIFLVRRLMSRQYLSTRGIGKAALPVVHGLKPGSRRYGQSILIPNRGKTNEGDNLDGGPGWLPR